MCKWPHPLAPLLHCTPTSPATVASCTVVFAPGKEEEKGKEREERRREGEGERREEERRGGRKKRGGEKGREKEERRREGEGERREREERRRGGEMYSVAIFIEDWSPSQSQCTSS